METNRTLSRLTSLLALCLICCGISAQTYRKITSTDDISDDGQYLIVATVDGNSYLMKDSILSSSQKKAAGVLIDTVASTITAPPTSCIWQIKESSSGWQLWSVDNGKTLIKASDNSDTDVNLSSTSSKAIDFDISYVDSLFQFIYSGTRGLRFSSPSQYLYFGLFTPSTVHLDLNIYKLVTRKEVILSLEQSSLPSTFALYTGTSALDGSPDSLYLSDVSDYWLASGLATDASALTITHTSDGSLLLSSGDTLLAGNGGSWSQYGDYAVFTRDSIAYVFAVTEDSLSSISLTSLDDFDELTQAALSVTSFAPAATMDILSITGDTLACLTGDSIPSYSLDSLSLLTLSGGWSYARLSDLNLTENALALFFTDAETPDTLPLLDLSETNCLIYLDSSSSVVLSDDQTGVVRGSELLRGWQLCDRKPFFVPQSFTTSDSVLITYSRTFSDEGWQTLFIPFEPASLPLTYQTVIAVTDEQARLNDTDSVAYRPLLCQLTSSAPETLTFTSLPQTILPTSDVSDRQSVTGGYFCGVAQTYEVTSSDIVYALSEDSDGSSFTQAAAGSTISPFRAYLKLDSDSATKLLPTGISAVTSTSETNQDSYNILGQPSTGRESITIKNNKKYFSKP